MPRRLLDNSQETPRPGSMDRPRCPRPREAKLLAHLADGTARSVSDAMLKAGFNPSSTAIRERLRPGGDLREELERQLIDAGLSLPRIMQKLSAKIDAKKLVAINKEAISTDDNDAQLRAVAQVIDLHERTGKLPGNEAGGNGGSHITVNVLMMAESPNLKSNVINEIETEDK